MIIIIVSRKFVELKKKWKKMPTRKKAVISVICVGLCAVLIYLVADTDNPQRDTHKEFDIAGIRQITKISEIEDREVQSKVINAIARGDSEVYNGDTGYAIVYVETDRAINIVEGREYDMRNEVEIIYELGERTEEVNKVHVFEVPNIGTNYLVAHTATPMRLEGLREVVAIKSGETFKLIDAQTNKMIDAKIDAWYGEGLYICDVSKNESRYEEYREVELPDGQTGNVRLSSKNLNPFEYVVSNAERTNVLEIEATVVSKENKDGLVELDLGNGYSIEAESMDKKLLMNMKYKIKLVYSSSGFKFMTKEMLYKPDRGLSMNE